MRLGKPLPGSLGGTRTGERASASFDSKEDSRPSAKGLVPVALMQHMDIRTCKEDRPKASAPGKRIGCWLDTNMYTDKQYNLRRDSRPCIRRHRASPEQLAETCPERVGDKRIEGREEGNSLVTMHALSRAELGRPLGKKFHHWPTILPSVEAPASSRPTPNRHAKPIGSADPPPLFVPQEAAFCASGAPPPPAEWTVRSSSAKVAARSIPSRAHLTAPCPRPKLPSAQCFGKDRASRLKKPNGPIDHKFGSSFPPAGG